MNPDQSIQASFWLMVIIQTVGSIDMPDANKQGIALRKMPAPRIYVAIIAVWGSLQLLADAGQQRIAGTVSWVLVLVGLVLGPSGGKLIQLLNTISSKFQTGQGPATLPSTSGATAPTTPNQAQTQVPY